MAVTILNALDNAGPNDLADRFRQVQIGSILDGLRPRLTARTGLTSSATQVHNLPGAILAVTDTAGTTAITMVTGTPGAGEVQVTYDADGLATLVFGSGAVTAYNVLQQVLPAAHGATLAASI